MQHTMTGRVAAALLLALLANPAMAAPLAPAGRMELAQQDMGDDGGGDPAASVLRLNRLEEQIRNLTGQIEQLQFQNRKLDENLRKLQADTDFRLQDMEHGNTAGGAARPPAPQRRGDASPDAAPAVAEAAPVAVPSTTPGSGTVRQIDTRRPSGDAFDPAADPGAPGAPRALGSTTPSQPLAGARPSRQAATEAPRGPLDLMRPQAPVATPDATAPAVIAAPPGAPRDTTGVASLAPGGTRDEYEADLALYKQGQYDGAANGFAAFADKYPKDRMVPDAVYLAGESFARLGRHREAAEQFLKLSTDFSKAPRAPDALLRLGMSLNALGAKEQACATYQEVTRRYPTASADVRSSVDRELKRARCTGNG